MCSLIIGLDERTWYCDRLYGVIGRALAHAQDFEGECKVLATMLQVRTDPDYPKPDAITTLVKRLHKLPLGPHVKYLASQVRTSTAESFDEDSAGWLSDFFETKLDDAREARNAIAHDLATGIKNSMSDQDVESFIEQVKTAVLKIVDAYVLVFNLTQRLTKEDATLDVGQFSEAVIDWVCSIEND